MASDGGGRSTLCDGGPGEAAGYVAEVIGDLIEVAHIHQLEVLCYLLDMARMEATEIRRAHRRRGSSRSSGR